jgi:hypothetical protein
LRFPRDGFSEPPVELDQARTSPKAVLHELNPLKKSPDFGEVRSDFYDFYDFYVPSSIFYLEP